MEAKKQREPLTVVPGWAIILTRASQINPRVVAAGLTQEEATQKLSRAPRDDGTRFAIEISAVLPPSA